MDPTSASDLLKIRKQAAALMQGVTGMVKLIYGTDFEVVLVLAPTDAPNHVMVMSSVDSVDTMQTMLDYAASARNRADMVDASEPATEH